MALTRFEITINERLITTEPVYKKLNGFNMSTEFKKADSPSY